MSPNQNFDGAGTRRIQFELKSLSFTSGNKSAPTLVSSAWIQTFKGGRAARCCVGCQSGGDSPGQQITEAAGRGVLNLADERHRRLGVEMAASDNVAWPPRCRKAQGKSPD
jgi:hypothetical protein